MTIKSILFAYSGSQAQGSGLDFAIKVALHYDAWFTGVVRHGYSKMEQRIATIVSEEVHRAVREAENKQIADIMNRFHETVRANGLTDRSSYINLQPEMLMTLTEIARTYDLIVTGHHPSDEQEEFLAAYPDRIALQSGRPVLVVPDGYQASELSDQLLVAWDGKRSVCRALGDAIAMIDKISRVTILTVGASHTVDQHPDGGVMALLERHGIPAEHVHMRSSEKSVAATIQDAAEDRNAGLIVMGAFEHSKFSHDIFGGVTTEILKTVRVPVFMAH